MAAKRARLSELMGRTSDKAGSLCLEHLPELLGEGLPELPRNAVGRHRLIRSLQQRLGPNFRSLAGVPNVIKEFDGEIALEKKIEKLRAIKPKKYGGK